MRNFAMMAMVFILCSCGGGGGETVNMITPLSESNPASKCGTYRITEMEIHEADGDYFFASKEAEVWECYMAVDCRNKYLLFDLYAVDNGKKVLDDSFIRTKYYTDNFDDDTSASKTGIEIVSDTRMMLYANDVYNEKNGELVDIIYYFEKISDEVEDDFFDILGT